jgi:PAS domain S-box-containing protein
MLESELFALFERTSDAAFAVDREGRICSWNKAAEKLFGYTAPEVLHKTCYDLFEGVGPLGTRVCQKHTCVMQCVGKDAGIPNFDMSVKTRSGQRVWINMSTVVFENPRTGRCLLVHLAHDITDQKRTEELVHKMLDLSKELTGVGESAVRAAPVPSLFKQEKQVLQLFAGGKDSADVADRLGITAQTLRNHLHHINQKLRTHNRLEAVMNAIQRKLI